MSRAIEPSALPLTQAWSALPPPPGMPKKIPGLPPWDAAPLPQGDDEEADAPPLPDPPGPTLSEQALLDGPVPKWMHNDNMALSYAILLLSELYGNSLTEYGRARSLFNKNSLDFQTASTRHGQEQIAGERTSATTGFAGSLAASILGGVCGYFSFSPGSPRLQYMAQAVSQAMPKTVTELTSLVDKLMGGRYKADQARVSKSVSDMLANLSRGQDEALQQGYEVYKRNLVSLFDMMRQAYDSKHQTLISMLR